MLERSCTAALTTTASTPTARRPRRAPAEHHRPGGRPPADRQRGRHGRRRVQRRDLQLPRAACAAARRGHTLRDRRRHRGDRAPLRGATATTASTSSTACSPSRSGTRAAQRLLLVPRPARDQAAVLCCGPAIGWCSRRRSRRCCATRRSTRASTLDALAAFLLLKYVPAPADDVRRDRSLAPGHLLTADAAGISLRRWWDVSFRRPDSAAERGGGRRGAAAALEEAVRSHLVSDVPFGAFLSGGVDSSLVVALMSRELGHRSGRSRSASPASGRT